MVDHVGEFLDSVQLISSFVVVPFYYIVCLPFSIFSQSLGQKALGEILFLCGSNKRAVIATLSILDLSTDRAEDTLEDGVSCNLAYLVILFQFICY